MISDRSFNLFSPRCFCCFYADVISYQHAGLAGDMSKTNMLFLMCFRAGLLIMKTKQNQHKEVMLVSTYAGLYFDFQQGAALAG